MREIKFRYVIQYDRSKIQMFTLSLDEIQKHCGTWVEVNIFCENVGFTNYQIIARDQYINVKGYVGEYNDRHKNEVELYEGDIVEAWSEGSKGSFVITFRNQSAPMYLLFPAYQEGKFWNIHGSDLGRKSGDYYDDLKRVGNIYEHPHLINNKI